MDLSGLMSLLGGGSSSGLNDLLTEEQKKAMQQQSMMAMASSLLKAGGPSTTRTNLGQALGGAFEAGQGAMQSGQKSAVEQMLLRQKLQEAKTEQDRKSAWQQIMLGGGATTPAQAMAAPVTPSMPAGSTVARANMIGTTPEGGMFGNLSQQQRAILAAMPMADAQKWVMERQDKGNKWSQPFSAMKDGKPVMMRQNELGQVEEVSGAAPYEVSPEKVRAMTALGFPLTKEGYERYAAASRPVSTTTIVNEGQKGFENARNLANDFRSSPIVKDYDASHSAYKQVMASLKQDTPIGDVAAATKIMKLLDPGSVVRESELGIAMAATGKIDRLRYYLDNWASGKLLNPAQRQEFASLSQELMNAASDGYNASRQRTMDIGQSYGFDLSKWLGDPAPIGAPPSAKAAPSAEKPKLIRAPGGGFMWSK